MNKLFIIITLVLASFTLAMAQMNDDTFFIQMTAAAEQQKQTDCMECHTSSVIRPEIRVIPEQWKQGVHGKGNIACQDCHGGDPNDPAMAHAPERGFIGKPAYQAVPQFCGKCHAGVLENFTKSLHGQMLAKTGGGPNCVVCHGAHGIQRANINIINEQRCGQCHTYDRAKIIKQALSTTENKIAAIQRDIQELKKRAVYTGDIERNLFSVYTEFRALFHLVNVALVTERTDTYLKRLNQISASVQKVQEQQQTRKNFSVLLMLLSIGLGIILYIMAKTYK